MGLTIHYSLKFRGDDEEAALIVKRLREKALILPFKRIGDTVHLVGQDACNYEKYRGKDESLTWLLIQASSEVDAPERVIAFSAFPGKGCEPSNFGLCRFPKKKGWSWASFCKTQYASEFGAEHFVKCHLCVITMLDYAREIGLKIKVSDEGGYWKDRNLEKLTKEVGEWDAFVAAAVGKLGDIFGSNGGGMLEAPIKSYPDYEHLEAKGERMFKRGQPLAES